MQFHHVPVLSDRAVEYWASSTARRLVDGTMGRAGHSLRLLSERTDVVLLGIDRDEQAVELSTRRLSGFGERVSVVHGSYADLPSHLETWGGEPVDGILLDLGVSSPQLDDPSRGFSTRLDGPLDLRFDRTRGETAAEWLSHVERDELTRVLRVHGEVPSAGRVARAILDARDDHEISSTADLRRAVEPLASRGREARALARVFQAIRIEVNAELDELDRFLGLVDRVLAPGGRVVIISFHSLEDRRVKRAFQEASRDCVCPPELPVCACGGDRATLKVLTKRPVTANETELRANPRARSAKLRAAERTER